MLNQGLKRLFSGFLALVLVVGMLPPVTARAEGTETLPNETSETIAVLETTEPVVSEETEETEEIKPEPTETASMEPAPEETEPEETEPEETETTLPVSVQRVQDLIDALPDVDCVTEDDYDAVQAAYDAYEALTEKEKTLIQGAEIFEALFAWFNDQATPLGTLDSGECGDDLTWVLTEDFELIIEGTGAMTDYIGPDETPWYGYSGMITSVTLPEGLTAIGDHAFADCNMTAITIPDSVTSIGDYAFSWCYQLTVIHLPDSLTTIGDKAFCYCYELMTITIPAAVTCIGTGVFDGCEKLTTITVAEGNTAYIAEGGILYDYEKTTLFRATQTVSGSIVIPDTVTTISSAAFADCNGLAAVTLPAGLTTIGSTAFLNCSKLTSITIPDSVISIGYLAFAHCKKLTGITLLDGLKTIGYSAFEDCISLTGTMTIPASVTSVGSGAFSGCSLTAFVVAEGNTHYAAQDGILYNSVKTQLIQVPTGITGDVVIPEGVKSIGHEAFSGCPELTTVTIPASVNFISWRGFCGCTGLKSITVAEDNKDFCSADGVLYDKYKTEVIYVPGGITGSITIPEGVTIIDYSAFDSCVRLTSISIPASVGYMDSDAFCSCIGLKSITVATDNKEYASLDGLLYNKDKTRLLCVPAGITGGVVIADGVTEITENAFCNCLKITSITIPVSVTTMEAYTFQNCDSLTDIYYLGTGAQWEQLAADMRDYEINYATVHTTEEAGILRTGTCGNALSYTLTEDYKLIIQGSGAMKDYEYVNNIPWYDYSEQITSVILPDGLTAITRYAFDGCYSLTSITIPDSVVSIGDFAFAYSWNLESITIPADVFFIGKAAFVGISKITVASGNKYFSADSKGVLYNKEKTELLQAPYSFSGSYTIPSTVTKIAPYAFYNCFASAITIPNSVTEIGSNAFAFCFDLSSITIPASVTTIGLEAFSGGGLTGFQVADGNPNFAAVNGLLTNKAKTTLLAVPGGITGTLTVPGGITTIDSLAFEHCENLMTVILPNSVTSLGDSAFSYCTSLTSVTLPAGLTSLSDSLFWQCSSLNRIALPDAITHIGYGVFEGSGLTDVYYAGTEAQWKQIDIQEFSNDTLYAATIHYGEEIPDYTVKGTCGENLTWILKDDTLTISGTGAMPNFDWDSDSQVPLTPWYKYRNQFKKLVIESGVTTISDYAFYYCNRLTSVSIANSVTSIGMGAFLACEDLTTITIPKNVTSIGESAFSGCESLTAFKVASGNTSFKASNGLLLTYDGKNLVSAAGGLTDSVTVPKGVTTINSWAFSYCEKITSITLPEGLTTIGEAAFLACENLTSITIPNSVTSIANGAFEYCYTLTNVTLPAGLTSIKPFVFYSCKNLTSVTIPGSVTSIEKGAFNKCISLTNVYYAGTQTQWDAVQIGEGNDELSAATIHCESLENLEIHPSEDIRLVSGQSQTLTAYDSDGEKVAVTWSVAGSEYATITSSGKLTAKAVTEKVAVTVIATASTGATGTKIITILPKATSVTIGEVETTVDMYEKSTLTLTATTAPEDALNDVTWTTSNKKIATVDDKGLVTLLKPGTVTITATANDGSKKSDKVTLTVYYVDTASKLTATTDVPTTGLQPGQTGTITVKGSTVLDNSQLEFTTSNSKIATVENGIITAQNVAGTATITAQIPGDPLNRKATVTVKVIERQVCSLILEPTLDDHAQRDDHNGEPLVLLDARSVNSGTYSFTISAVASDYAGKPFAPNVTWVSNNTAIATVTDNKDGTATVTIKKGAGGECAITATSKDAAKVSANLWVSVRDYAPRLESSSLSMNLYQTSTVEIGLAESYDNSIAGVSIDGDFYADWNEGTLAVTAQDDVTKGTYTQTLTVTCANGETYDYTLKIKVTEIAPTVTVKQSGKYNLFYTDGTATLTVTAKGATVENVTVTDGDFSGEYADGTLTLTCNGVANPSKKVTLEIQVAGYEKPVEKTVPLSTVTTAPKLKLSPASSTVNTKLGEKSTTFQVLDSGEVLDLAEEDVAYSGSFADCSVANNAITLTLTGEKGGTATLNIRKDNWAKSIKLTHKVTVQTALPTLKLGTTTLKLNKIFPELTAETTLSLSQSNVTLEDVTVTPKTTEAGKIQVSFENGKLVAEITDSSLKTGTYSYTCVGVLENGTPLKTVTLKITVSATSPKIKLASTTLKLNRYLAGQEQVSTKVTVPAGYTLAGFDGLEGTPLTYADGYLTACLEDESDNGGSYAIYPIVIPEGGEEEVTLSTKLTVKVTTYRSSSLSATVTTKGKLDTLNPDSAITCTVKLKNCTGPISGVSLSGQDGDLFCAETNESGNVLLTLKEGEDYATNKTYKVTLDMLVCGQTVSKAISFKVTQSTLKLTASPATLTCYQATGRVATTLTVTSPTTAQIADVTLGSKTTAAFRKALGEDGLHFDAETGKLTLTLQTPALLTPGKTYTVYLDITPQGNAKNVKPTQVKLIVKVQK